MTTKQKAERIAHRHGFVLYEPMYIRQTGCGDATIDAQGNGQIHGECRGQAVCGYYVTAKDFWADVINEIEELGAPDGTCTDPACEFHNEELW